MRPARLPSLVAVAWHAGSHCMSGHHRGAGGAAGERVYRVLDPKDQNPKSLAAPARGYNKAADAKGCRGRQRTETVHGTQDRQAEHE